MEILNIVAAEPAGILSDDLFDRLYDFDSEGGPLTGKRTMYVAINQLNKRLQKVKKRIRAPRSGKGHCERYRLEAL